MSDSFPYIEVPEDAYKFVGEPVGRTRVYRTEGTQEEIELWFDAIDALSAGGQLVSPGGVTMFCPVSRAAVHKRAKEGKLTMFLFHVRNVRPILFGATTVTMREKRPYAYIPISEAKAWKAELIERGLEQGKITQEEVEGLKPDWHGEFMEWKSKWDSLMRDRAKTSDLMEKLDRKYAERDRLRAEKRAKKKGENL